MSEGDRPTRRGRRWLAGVLLAGVSVVGVAGTAEARPRPKPANPPSWARVQCRDGYYSSSRSSVACRFHGGVARYLR